MTMIRSVAGSPSSAAKAARADRPPTAADGSRPPTPSAALTPAPAASSRDSTCCAPVPDAATSPISPAATVCAKPRPTPPTTAVPQSGPITSRPRSAAMSLSVISCSTGMLSEKIMTSQPASSASIASANAYRPGTETSTSPGPPRRAAAAVVRGGGAGGRRGGAPGAGAGGGGRGGAAAPRRPRQRCLVLGADGDQQVVRARLRRRREPHLRQQAKVQLGGHGDQRRLDPVGLPHV